jgi:hypothetical protein
VARLILLNHLFAGFRIHFWVVRISHLYHIHIALGLRADVIQIDNLGSVCGKECKSDYSSSYRELVRLLLYLHSPYVPQCGDFGTSVKSAITCRIQRAIHNFRDWCWHLFKH